MQLPLTFHLTRDGGVAAIFSDHTSSKNIFFGRYSTFEGLAFVLKSAYPCLVTTAYHPTKLRNGSVDEFAEFATSLELF